MTPLRKDGDGNLLKNADGDLVRLCGGPPENTCNTCDPSIPDAFFVTFAGLSGSFALFNGQHSVSWLRGCVWRWTGTSEVWPSDPPRIQIEYGAIGGPVWSVTVRAFEGGGNPEFRCNKKWTTGAGIPCDPDDPYTEFSCIDTGCGDEDSCEDSAGATCDVSLV